MTSRSIALKQNLALKLVPNPGKSNNTYKCNWTILTFNSHQLSKISTYYDM